MGDFSKIEWTTSTFNPWVGCQKVSPGCDNCYAEDWAARYGAVEWGPHANRKRTSVANWRKPLQWQKDAAEFQRRHGYRHRVFCASLADVFDNKAPTAWREDLFALIRATPGLDWQLLTKRPQNIAKMLPADWGNGYANCWLGTTTEDAKHYRLRWPVLSRVPAAIRFISYEPAVGALGALDLGDGVVPDWVICGGESGPQARRMVPQHGRNALGECARHGIPFFHKQWGSYRSNPLVVEGRLDERAARELDPASNGKGGALLDGRLWREFPMRTVAPQAAFAF